GVVPRAERHVLERLENPRAARLRAFEMRVDVFDLHEHVLVYAVGLWRRERSARSSDHDVAGAGVELRMVDDASAPGHAKPFLKAERVAQPGGCGVDVGIDQNRDDCGTWGRPVRDHGVLLLCESISNDENRDCKKLTEPPR